MRFYGKGLFKGLRGCAKGWSIGLHFFEHITVRGVEGRERVATTVSKSGHGLCGTTAKVTKTGILSVFKG